MTESKEVYNVNVPDSFLDILEGYRLSIIEQSEAQEEMDRCKDIMELSASRVEAEVIERAGGDPRKVGSAESDRKRTYEIEKSKSSYYTASKDIYYSARKEYQYHKAMSYIFELRLKFIIAVNSGSI